VAHSLDQLVDQPTVTPANAVEIPTAVNSFPIPPREIARIAQKTATFPAPPHGTSTAVLLRGDMNVF
jgi:hypothetical protein